MTGEPNKRQTGARKEELAADYLKRQGVRILEMNYRCRQGEIDLIGRDGEFLVFFEVKWRRDGRSGYAAEAVDKRKQKRICRVSDMYRMFKGFDDDTALRYDVVAIDGDGIDWIKNAFFYC